MSQFTEKELLTSPRACLAHLGAARDTLHRHLDSEVLTNEMREAALKLVTAMVWYTAHSNALLEDGYAFDTHGRMRAHKNLLDVIVRNSGAMLNADDPRAAANRVLRLVDATILADRDLFEGLAPSR